jgi:inhibitor of KinA sporulation pathway (predicted exonuclease)
MTSGEVGQPLDGIVAVFDLEWTTWEGAQARNWSGPGEEREIVEIGAVKLDGGDGLREIAAFEILVRPRINPALSAYFTGLTGITQAMVDTCGRPFADALAAFARFIGHDPAATLACSFGRDPDILRRNCALAGIDVPFPDGVFRNVRPALARHAGLATDALSACDLPRHLGFPAPAAAHRGLGDARCIAEALRQLRRTPPK